MQPSMRCINASKILQCVVINFLNKTFASLPRKKIKSGNRITVALRHVASVSVNAPVSVNVDNNGRYSSRYCKRVYNNGTVSV